MEMPNIAVVRMMVFFHSHDLVIIFNAERSVKNTQLIPYNKLIKASAGSVTLMDVLMV